jgi:hemerythrin superfamily protein
MANLSKATAKVTGAAKAIGKALSGYPAIMRHLAGEHGEVATLMKRVAASSSEDSELREELFAEIRTSLLAHARAEEKEFYEPLREFPQTVSFLPQAVEDHRTIETYLGRLDAESCATDAWLTTFQALMRTVEAHVEREENQLFPAAKSVLDSQTAERMNERYEATEEREKERIAGDR